MSFYGQFNTDFHIRKYFPDQTNGICVDVGMGPPIGGSNTYHFEQSGWKCLSIEPNSMYCKDASGIRKNVVNCACGSENKNGVEFKVYTVNGNNQSAISSLRPDERLVESHRHMINNVESIQVDVRTLDSVLADHPWIDHIDFISIDTEDTELDVLKGFDLMKWQPKLLVIENNHDEPFIAEYLRDFGYTRVERFGVNDFFIQK